MKNVSPWRISQYFESPKLTHSLTICIIRGHSFLRIINEHSAFDHRESPNALNHQGSLIGALRHRRALEF